MNDAEVELLICEEGNKYYVIKNSNIDSSNKNIVTVKEFKILKGGLGEKYYKDKLIHREDGPAIESRNGSKFWYKNGELHREDGPAIEFFNGNREWYKNGELHRDDGPAVYGNKNGNEEYYLNGTRISEEKFYLEKELRGNLLNKNLNKKIKKI